MVNIILWIVFGGLAGWIATIVVGNNESFGIAGNVVVGIIGAFLGGWIADKLGIGGGQPGVDRPTNFMSFIVAILGAVGLLVLLNFIF
jgi:uncharacterized membrane protein YeaQ/YmgE (transglycosylase-associated protein family)